MCRDSILYSYTGQLSRDGYSNSRHQVVSPRSGGRADREAEKRREKTDQRFKNFYSPNFFGLNKSRKPLRTRGYLTSNPPGPVLTTEKQNNLINEMIDEIAERILKIFLPFFLVGNVVKILWKQIRRK